MQLVPLRMLNEWTYCRRLGILEWVHGEFRDNQFTVEGTHHHRRVDWPGAPIEAVAALDQPGELQRTRSVYLESETEGLAARMDLVEVKDGEVIQRRPRSNGVRLSRPTRQARAAPTSNNDRRRRGQRSGWSAAGHRLDRTNRGRHLNA